MPEAETVAPETGTPAVSTTLPIKWIEGTVDVVDCPPSPEGAVSPVTGSIETSGADSGEALVHAARNRHANAVRRDFGNTRAIIAYAPSFATIT